MQTHRRKKIEVIVEAAVAPAITALLDENGVSGYTVLPTLAGKGQAGRRAASGVIGGMDSVMIVAIVGDAAWQRISAGIYELLRDYSGIVVLSDVDVLRGERF